MNAKLWIFILLLFLSFFAKSQEILNAKVSDSIKQKDSIATISEVIIQSSRRNLKLNQGNIVMNVSGNKDFKTSTNILEVLRKTPGVTVDSEDGIFVGGRTSPAIFINGKPVVMSSQETAVLSEISVAGNGRIS
ncbi:glutaredoxin [Chryseobacterium ginsenosidimutans]|uniref:hypothetical protein n=1 Tax=Chryseobacterium ginsenosidimutans TaxID=687846 RepID=UPI00216A51A7|nr:hypothetical protein [Chryseobacterium ginsenosidimutans]MCS3867992.1 glutaredoxin [Chryseobacterium ginsenosidimutans]